jgi:hypothetical protein
VKYSESATIGWFFMGQESGFYGDMMGITWDNPESGLRLDGMLLLGSPFLTEGILPRESWGLNFEI